MKIKIEKKEVKYAAAGIAVIMLWFLVIRNLIAPFLVTLPPMLAMLIYNLGMVVGLYLLSNLLNGGTFKVKVSLTTFMILLGINILTAPYMVQHDGTILDNVEYWYVASDAAFASFWGYFMPKAQIWFFTYIITPVMLIFVLPVILSDPKKIRQAITGGHKK